MFDKDGNGFISAAEVGLQDALPCSSVGRQAGYAICAGRNMQFAMMTTTRCCHINGSPIAPHASSM